MTFYDVLLLATIYFAHLEGKNRTKRNGTARTKDRMRGRVCICVSLYGVGVGFMYDCGGIERARELMCSEAATYSVPWSKRWKWHAHFIQSILTFLHTAFSRLIDTHQISLMLFFIVVVFFSFLFLAPLFFYSFQTTFYYNIPDSQTKMRLFCSQYFYMMI